MGAVVNALKGSILRALGVDCSVIVRTAAELRAVVERLRGGGGGERHERRKNAEV